MRITYIILALLLLAGCIPTVDQQAKEQLPIITAGNTSTQETWEIQQHLPTKLLTIDSQAASGAYVPKKVSLQTQDGVAIKASYYAPANVPAPTIIMLHMYGRTRSDYSLLAKALREKGFAILTLDLRGHGESTYKGSERISYKDLSEEDWKNIVLDVSAAKDYVIKTQGASSIGILGAGLGADVALSYAAQDEDIALVVLLSPDTNYPAYDPTSTISSYGRRPLLLVATDGDTSSTETIAAMNSDLMGPQRAVILRGDRHGSDMLLTQNTLDDEIYTWFSFYLV